MGSTVASLQEGSEFDSTIWSGISGYSLHVLPVSVSGRGSLWVGSRSHSGSGVRLIDESYFARECKWLSVYGLSVLALCQLGNLSRVYR